jgi:hypothetical protein
MENKNWLAQKGNNFTDLEIAESLGISTDLVGKEGFNRAMLDTVHAQNMAGYIENGMSESEARHMADKQRHLAMKAAKENGLSM